MSKTRRYFLGLGSNLGNRFLNLARARRLLEEAGVKVECESSVYRTQPKGYTVQPWFYNQVLEAITSLGPMELLAVAKSIETKLRRVPTVRNGPRPIDVDILLAGKTVLRSRKLTIPHPRLARRNFVLIPLEEIAPQEVHPLLGKTVRALSAESRDTAAVEKLGPVSKTPKSAARRSPEKQILGPIISSRRKKRNSVEA
jgi:GTP cyclohydrolase IV